MIELDSGTVREDTEEASAGDFLPALRSSMDGSCVVGLGMSSCTHFAAKAFWRARDAMSSLEVA